MQTIILAAGRGTRMGAMTADRPKTLVTLNGKPIMDFVLESLPAAIAEVVLVVGYRGDMVSARYGARFEHVPIRYVRLEALRGTADALWNARPHLAPEPFLVLQGDDIHRRNELERLAAHPLAFGVHRRIPPTPSYLAIDADEAGNLAGSHRPTDSEAAAGIPLATGAYALDHRIFKYEPVRLATGEYGLPQTISMMAADHPVRVVPLDFWVSVNAPEDIPRAEDLLQ